MLLIYQYWLYIQFEHILNILNFGAAKQKEYLMLQSNYFGRADVALPGFQKYFAASSEREETRAKLMMEYMNKRGGTLSFLRIKVDKCGSS